MAFRPSFRRNVTQEEAELNMTPVMNLMVCLIPLLLTSAQFIKIGIIDLNLPPAIGASVSQMEAPKETEKKLDLAVTITDEGFFISSSLAILRGSEGEGPSIPLMTDGEYNFVELSNKLYELKRKAIGNFSDTEKIVIQAEPEINYQLVVNTLDAARNISVEGKTFSLFPEVSLAAGVI
ncbi:MAG: ExbD/TolR family protein [Candidatus Zhuqueibacterota bacterium]